MDLQRTCRNYSFATVRCLPRIDRHGFDVALVVAKLTYSVDPIGNARLVPSTFHLADVGDGHGGIRQPSDLEEEKPGTDVGMIGTAHPTRRDAKEQTVHLQVGGLRKSSVVFGPRLYERKGSGVVPGPPGPLRPTPLVHALARGGIDKARGSAEPHNPVGRGYAEDPLTLVGQPAHVIEPAESPFGPSAVGLTPPVHPCHGAFAPIPASWEPRRSRTGTHDARWREERAPIRPADFDPLHHAWAVPDLHLDKPIRPDTPVEIGGATREGVWRFKLPAYAIAFGVRAGEAGDDAREIDTHLDGMLIDADAGSVELSFRAAVRLPRKWERAPRVVVWGVGEMPDSAFDAPTEEQRTRAEPGLAMPGARA